MNIESIRYYLDQWCDRSAKKNYFRYWNITWPDIPGIMGSTVDNVDIGDLLKEWVRKPTMDEYKMVCDNYGMVADQMGPDGWLFKWPKPLPANLT